MLYTNGDPVNKTNPGFLEKGNRALMVHQISQLIDLINQGIVIESAYISMSTMASS